MSRASGAGAYSHSRGAGATAERFATSLTRFAPSSLLRSETLVRRPRRVGLRIALHLVGESRLTGGLAQPSGGGLAGDVADELPHAAGRDDERQRSVASTQRTRDRVLDLLERLHVVRSGETVRL